MGKGGISVDKGQHSQIETTTLQPVPMEERKSWIDVALIQAGLMICVPSLLLGGILAEGMELGEAILAGTIGYTIVIVLFCLMGIIGSDLGVPTCVTATSGFGRKGARYLVSSITFVSMIGWFAVQTKVCGSAFSNLLLESFHISFSDTLSTVVWGAVMLVTAVYGINALDKLNSVAVPALFVTTIVGCFMALHQFGTAGLFKPNPHITMSFAQGVILTVNYMAAGCLAASDVTRYQRTRKDTILSSVIGVMPASILMVVLGAVMTKVAEQYDITLVFCEIGIPVIGMLVLIAATWTTNTMNAYSGGIDAVLMLNLPDNRRAAATMVSGALGTLCAVLGMADHFVDFLNILGDLMMPMIGVIIADYWLTGKGNPERFQEQREWNGIGVFSWLAGYAIIKLVSYGIPYAQGIAAAIVLYTLLRREKDLQEKKKKIGQNYFCR